MVYAHEMARTNIDVDEKLLAVVMKRHGIHTKREAVDFALRRVAGEPMTVAEALAMQGAHAIDEVEDRYP